MGWWGGDHSADARVRAVESRTFGTSAIVIGNGIAGLLAARVLSARFDRVWIVERDHIPNEVRTRPGAPQARHAHALLAGGRNVLQRLYPGLEDDLIAKGATPIDWGADFAIHTGSGWMPREASGVVSFGCSRDLLEASIRQRTTKLANVHLLQGQEVSGLLASRDGRSVVGVHLRKRGSHDDVPRALEHASLVVDASGRASRAPQWLAELGYPRVRETTIDSCRAYASRWYERPSHRYGWRALLQSTSAPTHTRGGLIYPMEGDRWCVTLSGAERDFPPTDEAGFLDFAKRQASPVLHDAICDARPLTPIHGYRRLENRRRHYEAMTRWPERFIVLGDAACAFNPVFAQGMTVSALGVATLDRCLRGQPPRAPLSSGFASRFQRELARSNAAPWLMTTTEDLRWRATSGAPRTWKHRALQRYLDHIATLAATSPEVNRMSLEVWHLVKKPWSLLHPRVGIETLRAHLPERLREALA